MNIDNASIESFAKINNLYQVKNAKSLTFYRKSSQTSIDYKIIESLKELVLLENRPARICLHNNFEDQLHNMIICHELDTYYPPHMHAQKAELYQIISGRIGVVFFDKSGEIANYNAPNFSNKISPKLIS